MSVLGVGLAQEPSKFNGAQTKVLQETSREVANVKISCVYGDRFDRNIRRSQLLRGNFKTLLLCIFLDAHAKALFEEATGLAAGHLQAQLLGQLIQVPSNSCGVAVYEVLQSLNSPI